MHHNAGAYAEALIAHLKLQIANERSSTIVFPCPMELKDFLTAARGGKGGAPLLDLSRWRRLLHDPFSCFPHFLHAYAVCG